MIQTLCWQVWKDLFLQALNRHAPIQRRRLNSNPIPWLIPEIKKLMLPVRIGIKSIPLNITPLLTGHYTRNYAIKLILKYVVKNLIILLEKFAPSLMM